MKRKKVIQILTKAGFTFKEGGNHTKVYKDNVWVSTLGRHPEIPEDTVRKIEKQTNIKLK